jgi:hypothetical protein
MVSRCYFTGTVNGINGYDYTGGIAGYNSRYQSHNSVIEDCWSSGTVNGRINGGGIVGQNQMEAYLRRCYSTAVITLSGKAGEKGASSSEGAGGIAGYNQSRLDDAVTACVALNPSITTAGFEGVHRVIGKKTGNEYVAGSGVQTNNFAWEGMVITVGGNTVSPDDAGINGMDGQGTAQKPDRSVYEGLGWNFNSVWKMGGDGYPVLRWQK